MRRNVIGCVGFPDARGATCVAEFRWIGLPDNRGAGNKELEFLDELFTQERKELGNG